MSFKTTYDLELSPEQIKQQVFHRHAVGGISDYHWELMGKMQYDFMLRHGLKPNHNFLDVGCGCLRGGIHFIKYLDKGLYCGIDINKSLLAAGVVELGKKLYKEKKPRLVAEGDFKFEVFERKFDFMLSVSVFSHLPYNSIIRCLVNVRKHLKEDGTYFSSYFEVEQTAHLESFTHPSGNVSFYDDDPFHYSFEEIQYMAKVADLHVEKISDFEPPSDQRMLAFSISKKEEK